MFPPNSKTYQNHPANPAHSPEQNSIDSLYQNHQNKTAKYIYFISQRFHYCRFYSNFSERNSGVSAGLEGFNYRYHFNNKEADNEVIGEGNSYDFGARMYDGRLGRWWSVDAMQAKYSSLSPFVAFANDPNYYIDPGGETLYVAISKKAYSDLYSLYSEYNIVITPTNARGVNLAIVTIGNDPNKKIPSPEDIKKDPVLSMIFSSHVYLYSADEKVSYYEREIKNGETTYKETTSNTGEQADWIFSITPYGDPKSPAEKWIPHQGFEGQVAIHPNITVEEKHVTQTRKQLVWHALAECYYRTESEMTRDAAHNKANSTALLLKNDNQLGEVTKFEAKDSDGTTWIWINTDPHMFATPTPPQR